MSQTNVEIAKRFVDAFNRRDLNALMDTATPDIAFSPALARTIDDNRFQGREGMRAYFADVDSAWEEFRMIVDEYRDLGDRVLTLGRLEGRGRGSGAAVDTPQGGGRGHSRREGLMRPLLS
jgi:ketosteroid isomerase-like protein